LHSGSVPVLPGLDELITLNANNGSAGDMDRLAGLRVLKVGGPVYADKVVFGENHDRGDTESSELRAEFVVKDEKLGGAAEVACAVMKDAVGVKKLRYGVAVAAVPDFLKPLKDELFVAVEHGKRLAGGRHAFLREKVSREYIPEKSGMAEKSEVEIAIKAFKVKCAKCKGRVQLNRAGSASERVLQEEYAEVDQLVASAAGGGNPCDAIR
jgi:hypothetical protein